MFRVALGYNSFEAVQLLHPLPQPFFQTITESLTSVPTANKLQSKALSDGLRGLASSDCRKAVPRCYRESKQRILRVQSLHFSDSAQGQCEPISRRT